MPKFDVYSDGASRGNPGPAAYGYVIYADGVEIRTGKKCLGIATNNVAEYTAVVEAAKDEMLKDVYEINFFLDSDLVVKQMKGIYKVKNEKLIPLKRELESLLAGKKVTFTHVPRNQNAVADRLANEALDAKGGEAPAKVKPSEPKAVSEVDCRFKVYSDGASRGNPGPASYGYIIYADGVEIRTGYKFIGNATNNVAEYTALLEASKDLMLKDVNEIAFFLDSELVVKQMRGEYKINKEELKAIKHDIDSVLAGKKVSFTHIPRNQNKIADKLANQAIDEAGQ